MLLGTYELEKGMEGKEIFRENFLARDYSYVPQAPHLYILLGPIL